MLHLAKDLWIDQAGFVVSAELVLISTIGVIGVGTGLACVRDAVNSELSEVGCAITALDQSYCYTGFHGYKETPCGFAIKAQTAGSSYTATRVSDADRDWVEEERWQPHPDHDAVPHFRERDSEERIREERVIRKPKHIRGKDWDESDGQDRERDDHDMDHRERGDHDREDGEDSARRIPPSPLRQPRLIPAPDHNRDQ